MKTNKEMKEKYGWLIPRNRWTDKIIDGDFTELDSMPNGWRIAFGDKMCKELDRILKKVNFSDDYRISEIKEKYGFLHWYDNGVPKKIYKKYSKWLKKYEKKSKKVCVSCGKKGKIDYKQYWLEPLCKKCKERLR